MAAIPDTTMHQVGALPVRRDEDGALNVLLGDEASKLVAAELVGDYGR